MQKQIYTLSFFLLVCYLAKAQPGDVPPNADPGKCYAKCLIQEQPNIISETFPIYIGDYNGEIEIDSLYLWITNEYSHPIMIGNERDMKFDRKPNEEYEKIVFVMDTTAIDLFVWETFEYLEELPKKKHTEWREVLCSNQVNGYVIRRIVI